MEKQKMETADMVKENIEWIGKLFPHCVTETTDKNGNPVHAIDFDKLRQELGETIVEGKKERYQFTWPMKSQASALANTPTTMTLRPDKENSKNFDTTENLYIEGDNLEVLKVLRETYLGKVKMIYIDPPYNTGKDYVYKDNRFLTQREMDTLEGKYDEYGNLYKSNTESNGRFHTDWLNMMYPRLKVARDLLSDDGVIFISLNDCEIRNLRNICDEIFGEQNFVADLIWANKEGGGSSDSKLFRIKHEHICCYARNIENISITGNPINNLERYKSKDEYFNERGPYYLQKLGMGSIQYSESLDYPIRMPDGSQIYPKDNNNGKKACWRWSREKFEKNQKIGLVEIKKDSSNNWTVYTKQYLNCDNEGNIIKRTQRPMGIIEEFSSTQASKFFESINMGRLFDYAKPYELLTYLISKIENKDSLILDFFSGSATMAHAVMKLNAEDGGNRKFIMVQLAEETEEGSEARNAGYKNICEIGEERIRRAGEKVKEEAGLKGQDLDIGFRVLKLDSSNMKDVSLTPGQIGTFNFDDVLDNVKEGRTDLDLLFQIMLNNSIPLSANIEEQTINGHKIYNVNDGALIAVFDRSVDDKTITAIAKMQPLKFVMREPENSPENKYNPDNIIDNFEQIFDLYSPNTIRRVL